MSEPQYDNLDAIIAELERQNAKALTMLAAKELCRVVIDFETKAPPWCALKDSDGVPRPHKCSYQNRKSCWRSYLSNRGE